MLNPDADLGFTSFYAASTAVINLVFFVAFGAVGLITSSGSGLSQHGTDLAHLLGSMAYTERLPQIMSLVLLFGVELAKVTLAKKFYGLDCVRRGSPAVVSFTIISSAKSCC